MSDIPLVSVVIPCYKAEKFIARAIDSVFSQKYVNVQVIVVEDGVFDDTSNIVSKYGDKIEHIILKTNQGAPVARNTGLEKVKSDYVLFLDADDYLEGDLLIGLYNAIQRNNSSLAFAPCIKRGDMIEKESCFVPPQNEEPLMVVERWLKGKSGPNPSAVLWKTSEVRRIGGWNTKFTRNQDGELIIRAMLNGCTVAASYNGAGIYWQHKEESVSKRIDPSTFKAQEQLELYVKDWLEDNDNIKIEKALNIFRLRNALYAYQNELVEEGQYWEGKWKKHGGKLPYLPGYGVKNFITNAFYIFLALRNCHRLLLSFRRLKNKRKL